MKPRIAVLLSVILSLLFFAAQLDAGQCKAITKKGTQCKRQAAEGSEYCWQHGGKVTQSAPAKTLKTDQSATPSVSKSKETSVGTTATGKQLYVGPRGGVYHISPSGKKVYHKRK